MCRVFLLPAACALLLLLQPRVLRASWEEDQAGPAESLLFDATVRANYKYVSPKCNDVLGLSFWNSLKESKRNVCSGMYEWTHRDFGAMMLHNVSIGAVLERVMSADTPLISAHLTVAHASCPEAAILMRDYGASSTLVGTQSEVESTCTTWVEDPVVIMSWFDTTNWWHFVEQGLLPAFLYTGIAQADLMRTARNVRLMVLRWPEVRERNTRTRGVYPTWVALPEILERIVGPLTIAPLHPPRGTCYRTILLTRDRPTLLDIHYLTRNVPAGCYSPLVRAAADHMRASMGAIPPPVSLARRTLKIVFIMRDPTNTWTAFQAHRNVNQTPIIDSLALQAGQLGCKFEVLRFYYKDMVPAREQVLRVSDAQIIVGVHGAGLALMTALPPGASVVELCASDPNTHFQYLAALLGHTYYRADLTGADTGASDVMRAAVDDIRAKHPRFRMTTDNRSEDRQI